MIAGRAGLEEKKVKAERSKHKGRRNYIELVLFVRLIFIIL
jgi:hypothetical protein